MSSEFKPIPTSLGGLLGGAGGYALAHLTDMDAKGKALMSAAGAALGGGLGYAGSKDTDTVDTTKAEIAEARDILRRRNRLARLGTTMLVGGLGSGATKLLAPTIADKHHREYVDALTKPHKEWATAVRALAEQKQNKALDTMSANALRKYPGITVEQLTASGEPMRRWKAAVKAETERLMTARLAAVHEAVMRNGGTQTSSLYVPRRGEAAFKSMWKEELARAKNNLAASKPTTAAAFVPAAGSADYRRLLAGNLRAARTELAASKPAQSKVSKLLGTLTKRRRLYTALGLGATLGAAGLANWLVKDPSLD